MLVKCKAAYFLEHSALAFNCNLNQLKHFKGLNCFHMCLKVGISIDNGHAMASTCKTHSVMHKF